MRLSLCELSPRWNPLQSIRVPSSGLVGKMKQFAEHTRQRFGIGDKAFKGNSNDRNEAMLVEAITFSQNVRAFLRSVKKQKQATSGEAAYCVDIHPPRRQPTSLSILPCPALTHPALATCNTWFETSACSLHTPPLQPCCAPATWSVRLSVGACGGQLPGGACTARGHRHGHSGRPAHDVPHHPGLRHSDPCSRLHYSTPQSMRCGGL